MTMTMHFLGGMKVQAQYKGYTVLTDQPEAAGGQGEALSPFDLFLTSIGTCAGFFVLRFCQERNLSTDGIHMEMRTERDEAKGMVGRIVVAIQLPPDFPRKYKKAIAAACSSCTVKKHIFDPPAFDVEVELPE